MEGKKKCDSKYTTVVAEGNLHKKWGECGNG